MHRLFVTAPRYAESALAEELRELGAPKVGEFAAGVRLDGDLELAYRICLWSRVASRVLLHVADVDAADGDALYRSVGEIDWSAHLGADRTFAVDCTSRNAAIGHSHFASLRVKDAIVDAFRRGGGRRPNVDVERPDVQLRLHLDGDVGRLYLDLAGESLHRRGYRGDGGAAPLKENLAAAVLRRARWPQALADGLGLLDPMCGSGTLLIEAAMMAADRAPGLGRAYFGFLGWAGHRPEVWARLVDEARERAEHAASDAARQWSVVGRDADPKAVAAAQDNVRRAGFDGRITVEHAELRGSSPPWSTGLLVVNTPYGERLGEPEAIAALFDDLGEALAGPYAAWRAAILCADPSLSSRLRRRIKRRHRFFNGNLEVELLSIEPRDDAEDVRALPAAADVDIDPFSNRIAKNLKRLAPWRAREQISCFRAYDADIPEFAAAVDVYGDWVHLQEYAPPRSIEPAWARARLAAMAEALPQVFDVPADHIVVKTRARQRGREQYERFDETDREFPVVEGAARYLVNVHDHLDTGLFLDHRPTRARLTSDAPARLLNLFCYTGSLTVAAALGGTRSSISVDASTTYLRWAARNFELNRLGRDHRLVRADVWTWLDEYRGPRFDLVVCDPPTFSNSKSRRRDFEVGRDHVELIRLAMTHVDTGGCLLFSSNKRGFDLDEAVRDAFAVRAIGSASVPPDFARGTPPHRQWEIRQRLA